MNLVRAEQCGVRCFEREWWWLIIKAGLDKGRDYEQDTPCSSAEMFGNGYNSPGHVPCTPEVALYKLSSNAPTSRNSKRSRLALRATATK